MLVITELELGGAQKHVLAIARRLPRDRYTVSLVTNHRGMLLGEARAIHGLRVHIVPALVRPVKPLSDLLAFARLWRLFRRERPDLVHTHSSKAGILGRWAAKLAGVPRIVHTVHGWGFGAASSGTMAKVLVRAERLTARITDRLIAVSDGTRTEGLRLGIGPDDRYEVIHHAIDIDDPAEGEGDGSAVRESLGIPPDAPVVVMVACFKPQKAPLDFVAACATVAESRPGAHYVMAGDGELRDEIELAAARHGLGSMLHLAGWCRDVPALLRAADVFVLTSRWEGLPGAVLEAMAAGVPVVATDVGGIREVVVDGVSGYVVRPGAVREIADRIRRLLDDAPLRASMGRHGRAAVDARFEAGAMVERLDRLYTGLPSGLRDGREQATAVISALGSGFRDAGPSALCAVPLLCYEMLLAPFFMLRARRLMGRLRESGGGCDWTGFRNGGQLDALYIWTETWPGAQGPGGVMTHTTGVLAGFVRNGVGTTAICPGNVLADYADKQVPVEPRRQASHLPEVMEAEYNDRVCRAAFSLPAGVNPGLVYHRHSRNHFAAAIVAGRLGVPFVLEYNGSILWEAEHWGRRLWFPGFTAEAARLVLRSAQLVTVVSDKLREDLLAQGVPGERILVNPNGVDADIFSTCTGGNGIREKYGLVARIVIGHTSTFRKRHGVDVLVKAVARMHREKNDVMLLLIGDGPALPEIRSMTRQYGLDGVVKFTGLVPHGDVPACLAACDVLVCPQVTNSDGTVFHGSPTKLFEYMAMAKAVVGSGVGQIRTVLDDGENGCLVDPGDAEALAHVLKELAGDAGLRERLGRKAREKVTERYTWNHHIARLMSKLYEQAEQNNAE